MSESESIINGEVEEYIAIDDSNYVVLTDNENLGRDDRRGNCILLANEGGTAINLEEGSTNNTENVILTNDGQMDLVEGVHEIFEDESADQLVFQHEEVVVDEPEQKTPAQLRADLEEKRKRLNLPKVPKKFLLFDGICAEIVDYDEEDGAPYVEFSMVNDDKELERLPVECGVCPDIMHRTKLDVHLKTHIKPGTKRYMCIYCEEDFVTRAYAAGHARRHMGIRPYVCVPCKMYYCTKQDLKVHEQRRHLAKEHICEHCGRTFAQNTSLKHHRLLVHEQQRNYECEHCGKRFLRKYAKNEHVRNVHFGDRRLLDCPFCDMHFKDTHKLAQHRKQMHLNQSTFECRACGLEFSHIDFFDAHRRSLQCRKKLKRQSEPEQETEYNCESFFQMKGEHDDDMLRQRQQHLQSSISQQFEQEVVVEEVTHDMHAEIMEDDEDNQNDIEVDEHEKVEAEQQLLYEIAAMDHDD